MTESLRRLVETQHGHVRWCRHAVHSAGHESAGPEVHAAGVREPLLRRPGMVRVPHGDRSRSGRYMRGVWRWGPRICAVVIVIISKSKKFVNRKGWSLVRCCRRLGPGPRYGEVRVVRQRGTRATTTVGVPMEKIHDRHHEVTVRLIAVRTVTSRASETRSVLQSSLQGPLARSSVSRGGSLLKVKST